MSTNLTADDSTAATEHAIVEGLLYRQVEVTELASVVVTIEWVVVFEWVVIIGWVAVRIGIVVKIVLTTIGMLVVVEAVVLTNSKAHPTDFE